MTGALNYNGCFFGVKHVVCKERRFGYYGQVLRWSDTLFSNFELLSISVRNALDEGTLHCHFLVTFVSSILGVTVVGADISIEPTFSPFVGRPQTGLWFLLQRADKSIRLLVRLF